MPEIITLMPVDATLHTAALQAVYRASPRYWRMVGLPGAPENHAERELAAAQSTAGRSLLGIVRRLDQSDPSAGAELIGVLDFRLDWPEAATAYIAMLMVAEPLQRRGIGTQAWSLLKPWLANAASIRSARVGVEQFNIAALKFWETQGFALTGESDRVRVRDRFVRLLYMTATLASE